LCADGRIILWMCPWIAHLPVRREEILMSNFNEQYEKGNRLMDRAIEIVADVRGIKPEDIENVSGSDLDLEQGVDLRVKSTGDTISVRFRNLRYYWKWDYGNQFAIRTYSPEPGKIPTELEKIEKGTVKYLLYLWAKELDKDSAEVVAWAFIDLGPVMRKEYDPKKLAQKKDPEKRVNFCGFGFDMFKKDSGILIKSWNLKPAFEGDEEFDPAHVELISYLNRPK
jgi:hypothetical protein